MMAMRRAKEPVERTAKRVMLLKGTSSSETMNAVLQDLSLISKPNHKTMTRKNDILPFEDVNSLEFLGQKNDCGLFAFVSHTKKRPHNLVLGRFFDGHLLDMFEFGVDPETKKSLEDFSGEKKGLGSKPLLLFNGDQWANEPTYKAIQNLFIDFFRGDKTSKLCMKGVDHAISFTLVEGKIHLRTYGIRYQKSSSEVPEMSMVPMGPFYDMTLRRTQVPSPDLWKAACQKDKRLVTAKVKNVKTNSMGTKLGRIHMKPQNLDKMDVRRTSVLRSSGKRDRAEGAGAERGERKQRKLTIRE